MKNKKIFGIPLVLFIIVILVSGGAIAGILSFYGKIIGTATVQQSVLVDGGDYTQTNTYDFNGTAGSTDTDCGHNLKNNAEVTAIVQFATTCKNSVGYDDGTINELLIDWSSFGNNRCDGITTEIYGTLELTSKDTTTWNATNDLKATLYYTIVGENFWYKIDTENNLEDYIIVYYPDVNSSKPWNIGNAETIGNVESDWTQSTLLDHKLPLDTDYNANANEGNNYCDTDNYEHCVGAKIWLMPESELGSWSADDWLFETDLISYSKNNNNEITLLANGGGINFCIANTFDIALSPDTYTTETEVTPPLVLV